VQVLLSEALLSMVELLFSKALLGSDSIIRGSPRLKFYSPRLS